MRKIDSCFGGADFGVMILESNCVAGTAIEDGNSDHIGYRVLLKWSDCGYIYLLRCFDWGGKFESCHIGDRRMEFDVGSHFGGTGIGIHDSVGRNVG